MQDNEIIKALECCYTYFDCAVCPYEKICTGLNVLTENTLDLINRQKAEIERLKAEAECADGYADALVVQARAEAIKEFAERVKGECESGWLEIRESVFDNLVKEMTEQ